MNTILLGEYAKIPQDRVRKTLEGVWSAGLKRFEIVAAGCWPENEWILLRDVYGNFFEAQSERCSKGLEDTFEPLSCSVDYLLSEHFFVRSMREEEAERIRAWAAWYFDAPV